jgi:transposase
VRSPGARANQRHTEVRTFATTTNALLELRDWLIEQKVTLVAMEATGDYWRPPLYLLEDDVNVILVNPVSVATGLPGRKSDVSDSMWLAQLAECGLLKASFVPPQPIRELRDLTRYRTTLAREHTREASRLARLDTIPGVGRDVAEVIIAETGGDMSRFPTPGHLASWAGVAPGLNQSGERRKPGRTRHGDHWLTGALGVAAMAANRTRDTSLSRRALPTPGPAHRQTQGHGRHPTLDPDSGVARPLRGHRLPRPRWRLSRQTRPPTSPRRITRDANRLGYTVRFDPIQAA